MFRRYVSFAGPSLTAPCPSNPLVTLSPRDDVQDCADCSQFSRGALLINFLSDDFLCSAVSMFTMSGPPSRQSVCQLHLFICYPIQFPFLRRFENVLMSSDISDLVQPPRLLPFLLPSPTLFSELIASVQPPDFFTPFSPCPGLAALCPVHVSLLYSLVFFLVVFSPGYLCGV